MIYSWKNDDFHFHLKILNIVFIGIYTLNMIFYIIVRPIYNIKKNLIDICIIVFGFVEIIYVEYADTNTND